MTTVDIVSQLEAALSLGGIPDSARKRGRALFETLSRPVRVVLLGPASSGKSALVNLLLGEPVLPEASSARIVEIVPGDTFLAEASYADGRLEAPEDDELASVENAERLLIAAPHPILRSVALVEARGDDAEAVADVTEHADIVLWCSPDFAPSEREIWADLQDAYRDHAFLVLTKADQLARKNRLADTLLKLAGAAETDFAGLFPIATLQGLKALATTPRDEALWTGSGADALVRALLDHARSGRRADLDQAELFLARYAFDLEQGEGTGIERARSRTRPRSQTRRRPSETRLPSRLSEPESRDEAHERPERVATAMPPGATATAARIEPAAEPAAPAASPVRNDAESLAQASLADRLVVVRNVSRPLPNANDVADGALKKLRATGMELRALSEDPGGVLTLCADTADALQGIFDESPLPESLAPLADDLALTSEMMTLLRLENAPGPAAEAVTLLLQIKRELEQVRAA